MSLADESPAETKVQAGRTTNLLCGVVVSLLGVGSLIVAADLGLGSFDQPQAGTWPGLLSVLFLGLGIALILRAHTYQDAEKITRYVTGPAVGAVSLLGVVFLMPRVGFELPSAAVMIFWMSVLGKEKYKLSIPLAIFAVLAFYLIFVTGLGVPIPRLF